MDFVTRGGGAALLSPHRRTPQTKRPHAFVIASDAVALHRLTTVGTISSSAMMTGKLHQRPARGHDRGAVHLA